MGRARHAEKLASTDGYWVLDAILNSAIALEAFPNDFIRILETSYAFKDTPGCEQLAGSLVNVFRILPELEPLKVQIKYQMLYQLLCGKTFDRGTKPFQDFDFLIILRNEIVHPKCEGIEEGVDEPYEKVTKKLLNGIRARKLSNLPDDFHVPWKRHLENGVAASWAVSTARAMINAISEVVPESSLKRNWLSGMISPNSSLNRPL